MAFSASIIFKGVDQVSKPMRSMDNSINRVSKSLGNFSMLAGGLSIATAVYSGLNAVKDYDSAIASLKAITGLAGEEFVPFRKEIQKIGDGTKKSFVEVGKAMQLIGSAQPELLGSAESMGKVTESAILLSKASGIDLPTSASALTTAMNQFGASADEARKYVDILSTSEQKGTAVTQQVVDALINGGSAAKTLGLSFDETNAIIQAYAKAGVMGSKAGTQMASALSKMAKDTNKNFNPTVVGATKAIDNLAKANLSYKQLIEKFDEEGAKNVATLLNQNHVVQRLSGNLHVLGNAQKQADERSKSIAFRIDELTATFQNLFITGSETSGALNAFGYVLKFITDNMGLLATILGAVVTYYGAMKIITTGITAVTWLMNTAQAVNLALQGKALLFLKGNTAALVAIPL